MTLLLARLTIFLLLILGIAPLSKAQTIAPCGTVPPSEEKLAQLERQMREVLTKQYRTSNSGMTCVPIKVHDIRDDAGNGALNMTMLNRGIANLNYHYAAAGIEFFLCGSINTVNNSIYYDFDSPEENTLTTVISPRVTNAFNLYLTNTAASGGSAVAGYAYFPANNAVTTVCVMDKSYLANSHNGTLIHEYGHHFNLQHTHRGTENGNADANAENVPRAGAGTNCTTQGDFLCDTHADPRGATTNCVYTGGGTDILGNAYTPPLDNIMSYYPDNCGGLFTAGQYSRIVAALTVRQGHSAYNLSCAPTAVTAPSGVTSTQVSNAVIVNWTDNAANESGYLIERSTTSASAGFAAIIMGGVAPNVTTFSDNSIASNTTYWYRVKSSNGNCNTYSNVATVTTGLIYCLPTYNTTTYCLNATISNVTMAGSPGFNNSSTCSGVAYADYTNSISATVVAGSSYAFSITRSASYNRYLQVYIDFNQDGDFNDANEKILPDNTAATAVYSSSVTIPATALNGNTRMRVIMRNLFTITSACETNMDYGEAEDYRLTVTGGALPVGLLYFTGVSLHGDVQLNWATSFEQNNKSFIVEKSINGTVFSVLDTVEGKGHSVSVEKYILTDAHPFAAGTYYRIKQVNDDGSYQYYSTILVNSKEEGNIVVYPNPAQHTLNLTVHAVAPSLIQYDVLDFIGNILWSGSLTVNAGGNSHPINIAALAPGMYYLHVKTESKSSLHRIIKQ
jgi:hypothetical protein